MIIRKLGLIGVGCAVFAFAGCGEIDQKAKVEKVYAGKKDTRAFEDARFGGDRRKWETTLAERSKAQNEYLRTELRTEAK
ncbi:MAG: hypothetical protein ING75_12180 [Rhodocyclaceae bacterium]|nr:hypothetical protein [Rhodocyclaceae bacterium]